MAYGKILVAFDSSDEAKMALRQACLLTNAGLAESLVVLSVWNPGDPTGIVYNTAVGMAGSLVQGLQYLSDETEAALLSEIQAESVPILKEAGVVYEIAVEHGDPHYAITDFADKNGCGLIVVGNRGLGAIRSMLGSVSQAVLHHANVPVLVVK